VNCFENNRKQNQLFGVFLPALYNMTKSGILIILIISLTARVFAQQDLYTTQKTKVDFVSDAPLELIKASSDKLTGLIDGDKRTFAFTIPVRSFTGFNSPLQQEHFYENYMEEKTYPDSKFEGKIIEQVDFSHDGNFTIRAKGKLKIHGVEQERIIKVLIRVSKGVVYANSVFSVLLQDYNITIPKVVYQKISEEIKVTVSAEFVTKQ
jgi:polyisoprenoid-binding protein YceI